MILWVSAGFSTFSLYLRINFHSMKLSFSVRDVLPSFPHLCLVSEEASMKDANRTESNPWLPNSSRRDTPHPISILKYSFCINLSPGVLWRSCFNGSYTLDWMLDTYGVRKFCILLHVNFSNAVKRRSHEFLQNFFTILDLEPGLCFYSRVLHNFHNTVTSFLVGF